MEQYGNATTFNLESVLKKNILDSDYYQKSCLQITNWSDLVDEVYENVDHVEPWMSGNARGPSTAFCLMYRMATLKPSEQEVRDTIGHADSPYIRAVGFLYLRYVADPKTLWSWCQRYIKDQEEFAPCGEGTRKVTMGDFVRDLLLSQYYFETIFPRIPKPVEDAIKRELESRGLPASAKGNAGTGGSDRRGNDTEGNRRPASVKASLSVAFGQRAPNRAGAREDGRGRDPSLQGGGGGGAGSGAAPRGAVVEGRRVSRSPERPPAARADRDRERERERDPYRGDDAERYRSSVRDRGYERDRREPSYGRERDSDRSRREYDRDKDYDRDREYERGRGAKDYERDREYRRRSRSRDRR